MLIAASAGILRGDVSFSVMVIQESCLNGSLDVLSVPQPTPAIVGARKRDVPCDLDMPIPLDAAARTGRNNPALPGPAVVAMDGQVDERNGRRTNGISAR